MVAASTSRVSLRYKKESSWGTAASGNYQDLPITGDTLIPNSVYTRSNVIRSDGQIPYVARTDVSGQGTVNGELQPNSGSGNGAWDEWMEGVLLSRAWASPATTLITGTMQAVAPSGSAPTATPGKIVVSAGGNFANFTVGGWVTLGGFGTVTPNAVANNLTVYKIVGKSGTDTLFLQGQTLVAEAATASRSCAQLQDIANGVTLNSYSIEKAFTDDTDEFQQYLGAGIGAMRIEVPTTGIITTSFDVISKIPVTSATSIGGTVVTQVTTEGMTAANVWKVLEGDPQIGNVASNSSLAWDTSTFKLLQASMTVTPNLRSRKAIGTIGDALQFSPGELAASGTLRLYYNNTSGSDDRTIVNKVLNGTTSAFALVCTGTARWYVFEFPQLKWTTANMPTPGKSQDVILEMGFEAYVNASDVNPNSTVTGVTVRIARI